MNAGIVSLLVSAIVRIKSAVDIHRHPGASRRNVRSLQEDRDQGFSRQESEEASVLMRARWALKQGIRPGAGGSLCEVVGPCRAGICRFPPNSVTIHRRRPKS